jgi:hypothetical protein
MDAQARMLAMAYRIDHRHADGSWGEMVEDRTHHSPADPERSWANHRIFRCTSCDSQVTVVDEEGSPAASE